MWNKKSVVFEKQRLSTCALLLSFAVQIVKCIIAKSKISRFKPAVVDTLVCYVLPEEIQQCESNLALVCMIITTY